MKKIFLIVFQIAVISICAYGLYQDYQRVGHFQWTDPNAIEDDEELYINVYAFAFICLGVFRLLSQSFSRTFYRGFLRQATWIFNLMNAILLLFVGGAFVLVTIEKIIAYEHENIHWEMFATGLGLLVLAILIFLESNRKLRENAVINRPAD